MTAVASIGDRLMTADEVASILGQCRRSLYKNLSTGRMPQPVRIGRSVRWRQSDIQRFIEVGCDMQRFESKQCG